MKMTMCFEVRLDNKQGHLVIGGYWLPEVVCQEHARMQVTALKASHLLTEEEASDLFASIRISPLPNTWTQVMEIMVSQVLEERAKPYLQYTAAKAEQ